MPQIDSEPGHIFEGHSRKIIHVDMDAFYASVEQRDRVELRGRPVIVGGRPGGRGVVAACSYEARRFGVRSAMPSSEAARRCPDATFVKPRFAVYQQVSRQIQAIFREFTDVVEPLSLDEAYLDVTNNRLYGGSALKLARVIKTQIREETGLVASAGVSYNKFIAKIASDFDKPDGLYCVRPEDAEAFLTNLPVGRLHGVGGVTEAKMNTLGIYTISDLRELDLSSLEREFGSSAPYFYDLARGIDNRPVRVSRLRKSLGTERTFSSDIVEPQEMHNVLHQLLADVQATLWSKKFCANTITVKVRFADFDTVTRSHSRHGGVDQKGVAQRTVSFLLDQALADRHKATLQNPRKPTGHQRHKTGVRLLGVSFSALQALEDRAAVQLEFDLESEKGYPGK